MNKQQLANKIWASANKMRSKIEANEYKDFILGFIFYKFLSDKELSFLEENELSDEELPLVTESDQETMDYVRRNLGYFISYEHLFSTWLSEGQDFNIASVRDALSAFERLIDPDRKKLFGGIFDTLATSLSKLGASEAEQTRAVRDILSLIREIPTDGREDYDVLGFVYEYLISNFAANAGKKAGEFYTPHEVSLVMSDIIAHHLRHEEEIEIYDPTSGSGSLLINIGKSVARHTAHKDRVKYYAQELKRATYNLTRMNLIMRGINPANIEVRNGDTLREDWPYFDDNDPQGTYTPLYLDAVVSNPPYSQEWNPTDQESDPRYADFGLAPRGKADYAFLLHDLYHLKPSGIMTIVLPHGVLYRGDSEQEIRRALVEKNHIDAIIGLPEKVFFGTGIATIIMVLKRPETRADESILFVDASQGYAKEGKNNKLRASDIRRIVDTVTRRRETPDYARLVTREEIRQNDYNLNISRYVDSSPRPEQYDLYATMLGGIPESDLERLSPYWSAFPSLREEVLDTNAEGYSDLYVDAAEEILMTIEWNGDVKRFTQEYKAAFDDFESFLDRTLIAPMLTLNIAQAEERITEELFRRLAPFPLIDPYEAYQYVSDEWQEITADLEILRTEGLEAARRVDPRMVLKTKGGKEIEVQEGWVGRLLPLDLVQRQLLPDQVAEIDRLETRLDDVATEQQELLEGLSPEEQERSIVNDDATKFVATEVRREAKAYTKESRQSPLPPESYEARVIRIAQLLDEEKALKSDLKEARSRIEKETIATIRSISDERATELLREKWFTPIFAALRRMPEELEVRLARELKRLSEKYATGYADITERVERAESRLYDLLGDLEGSTADEMGLRAFRDTLKR